MPAPQPAPQGAPSPQGGPPQQQGGPSPAAQAVQMIQQGFQMLGKLIQSAGNQLPPEDIKLFQTAAQATDALLQSLTGPGDQDGDEGQGRPQPGRPQASGPMAANANAGAKPAGPQG